MDTQPTEHDRPRSASIDELRRRGRLRFAYGIALGAAVMAAGYYLIDTTSIIPLLGVGAGFVALICVTAWCARQQGVTSTDNMVLAGCVVLVLVLHTLLDWIGEVTDAPIVPISMLVAVLSVFPLLAFATLLWLRSRRDTPTTSTDDVAPLRTL